jgi:hypothetical protein
MHLNLVLGLADDDIILLGIMTLWILGIMYYILYIYIMFISRLISYRMMTSGYLYVCILVIMTIDWKLRRMS